MDLVYAVYYSMGMGYGRLERRLLFAFLENAMFLRTKARTKDVLESEIVANLDHMHQHRIIIRMNE